MRVSYRAAMLALASTLVITGCSESHTTNNCSNSNCGNDNKGSQVGQGNNLTGGGQGGGVSAAAKLVFGVSDDYIGNSLVGDSLEDSAVFPQSAVASAPAGIFTQTKMPAEIASEKDLAAQEMRAGGFLIGGAGITFDVSTSSKSVATIHDISLANVTRMPIVTGKAFIVVSQGGGNEGILFRLDSPNPVGDDETSGKPWQETRHSDVSANKPDTFHLDFTTALHAYTFNVAVDYTSGGKDYTQLLAGQDGKPLLFRVTADLCPPTDAHLSSGDRAKLGSLHYSSINSNALTNLYSLTSLDPKAYGPQGIACSSAPNNKVGQG